MNDEQYIALAYFEDSQDDNTAYDSLTIYPREGYEPSLERIEQLMSSKNKRRKPVIARLKRLDPKPAEKESTVDNPDDLEDKTVDQLKELADEKEVEYNANIKKADLIDLLRK